MESISQSVSRSILEEILEGVLDSRNICVEFEPDFNTPKIPTKSLEEFNPRILSRETLDDPNIKLYQIETERQRYHGTCGYNALYNGWLILNQLSQPEKEIFQRFLRNKSAYWDYAVKVNKMLLKKGKSDSKYPWSEKFIRSFILEREYMEYLIGKSKVFHSLPNVSRLLMESGFIGIEEIEEIQSVFDDFKKGERNMRVFSVGSLSHWFSFVVNRYEKNNVEGIVADSVNWLYFGFNDSEDVKQYMRSWIAKKYKDYKKTPELFKKMEKNHSNWTACMLEGVWSCHLILDCCVGKKNFIVECLDTYIFGLMKQYCHAKNDVYMFMDRFADPAQIRYGLFRFFNHFKAYLKDLRNLVLFKEWINMLMEDLQNSTEKLHKDEFNTPKLLHSAESNQELMWEIAIKKNQKKKKEEGVEVVKKPDEKLNESDLENREKMTTLLLEFKELISSINF